MKDIKIYKRYGVLIVLLLSACASISDITVTDPQIEKPTELIDEVMTLSEFDASNPFYTKSNLYFQFPPFDRISNQHYAPAFTAGMHQQRTEINAITANPESATIENTLAAMEQSGRLLNRVSSVFFSLASVDTNDEIEALRSEIAPKLSAHNDAILLDEKLFLRIKDLHSQLPNSNWDPETQRLVAETYKDFVRVGAALPNAEKEKLKSVNARLATLTTKFSQNVLEEVNAKAIIVEQKEQLTGLSENDIAAAVTAAMSRGLEGKYVLPLLNTSGQPLLASLTDRALRERIYKTSLSRGNSGGEFDNREILSEVLTLRAERAKLLGFANHAGYSLSNQTAQTVQAVNQRLATLIPPAVENAKQEAADLQAMIDAEGNGFTLAPWDWSFYTNKLRAQRFNFDSTQLKPYLEMNNVLTNGVFYMAERLYGLTFKLRLDLPTYHPDVRVWEVFEEDGSTLALFIEDFYARESKRGGAWMNAYVSQSKLLGNQPVVANHLNVSKPPEGEPTLLTWGEANTMFHEFGHALHGMFSNVTYPYFSGTSVPRDFVEYPSQVNEMWIDWPEVLTNYAVHYETGETMPDELLEKVLASSTFNQGFATSEYLAATVLDQRLHQLQPEEVPNGDNLMTFEAQTLADAGIAIDTIPPRYRSTYFSHIIGGYSAGYYSYIWSEVLDADSVEWFKENGGLTRENGDHFRKTLLSRGGSEDAMTIFREFRGAEPNIQPLLERRGLQTK